MQDEFSIPKSEYIKLLKNCLHFTKENNSYKVKRRQINKTLDNLEKQFWTFKIKIKNFSSSWEKIGIMFRDYKEIQITEKECIPYKIYHDLYDKNIQNILDNQELKRSDENLKEEFEELLKINEKFKKTINCLTKKIKKYYNN